MSNSRKAYEDRLEREEKRSKNTKLAIDFKPEIISDLIPESAKAYHKGSGEMVSDGLNATDYNKRAEGKKLNSIPESDLIYHKGWEEFVKPFVDLENSNKKGGAKRYNKGKSRHVLIPPFAKEALADVYTRGAHKYSMYKDKNGNVIQGKDIPFENVGQYELVEDASSNWRLGQD
ncbi:MAG: hypothetical protein WBA57_04105, partial [Elainellaceae cyanobacterium]